MDLDKTSQPGLSGFWQQGLVDQRNLVVSAEQYQALLVLLDSAEVPNPGLVDLFSRKSPWEASGESPNIHPPL